MIDSGAKAPASSKSERELSKISFPYFDLDTAIEMVHALANSGGREFTRDQIASQMKQSPTSGAFLLKLSAARMFGFLDNSQGKYQINDLGYSVLDRGREKQARATAFLNVPLYERMYQDFKGKPLPVRPQGLENAFIRLGVTPKRAADARNVFDRSGIQAGFFPNGNLDRLVEPIVGANAERAAEAPTMAPAAPAAPVFVEEIGPSVDPLIKGLLDRLPKPGEKWPHEKRLRWLQTFAANLDYVYPPEENDKFISIESKSLSGS